MRKVELIPVIEITNYDQGIPIPSSGPYWEFPDEWESYHILGNLSVGFSEELKPYFKSSSFYRISDISDTDLLKVIRKEICIQQTQENKGVEDVTSSFDGGYVLRIDHEDKYFPQCCGKLGDIEEWIGLLDEDCDYFYMGHSSPAIRQSSDKIILDFVNSEIQDGYVPPVLEETLEIERLELEATLVVVQGELDRFAERLKRMNTSENLNFPDIDRILIYGIDE